MPVFLLRVGRSGDPIPVGARFSAPIQTGPGAHPASYTMGTGSSLGATRPGRGVDHLPPSSAKVKERVELYPYSNPGPSCHVEFIFKMSVFLHMEATIKTNNRKLTTEY